MKQPPRKNTVKDLLERSDAMPKESFDLVDKITKTTVKASDKFDDRGCSNDIKSVAVVEESAKTQNSRSDLLRLRRHRS